MSVVSREDGYFDYVRILQCNFDHIHGNHSTIKGSYFYHCSALLCMGEEGTMRCLDTFLSHHHPRSFSCSLQVINVWWNSTWSQKRRERSLPVWISCSTTALSTNRKCSPCSLSFPSLSLVLSVSDFRSDFCTHGNSVEERWLTGLRRLLMRWYG